jgi:DNA polymerase-1
MLLIDGDLLVFKAAAYWQEKYQWEEGGDVIIDSHEDEAWNKIVDTVQDHITFLNDSEIQIIFSDRANFRKVIWPDYKANRDPSKKPKALGSLRKRCEAEWDCVCWKNLEADDVLGILCTRYPEYIAVTEDKDQAVVPGKWYNYRKPELGVVTITKEQADHQHLVQTMMGDSSDGYKGIPRVGVKTAEKILAEAKAEFLDPWACVVMAYMDKEMTKEDALLNARMAYILRDGDYNEDTGEVRLWKGGDVWLDGTGELLA